jgi:hypothetical protein
MIPTIIIISCSVAKGEKARLHLLPIFLEVRGEYKGVQWEYGSLAFSPLEKDQSQYLFSIKNLISITIACNGMSSLQIICYIYHPSRLKRVCHCYEVLQNSLPCMFIQVQYLPAVVISNMFEYSIN